VRLVCAGAADAVTAAEVRRALQRWLKEAARASAEVRDDILLGVNEALANCVEHAYRAQPTVGPMRLEASHDPAAQAISVCVSDRGTWHRPRTLKPTDPCASRGIMLMHNLADHCTISARPSGTTVCLDYTTQPSRDMADAALSG
jgi:anti-sigma regulatory factor (Ser/Thr protein kinase)